MPILTGKSAYDAREPGRDGLRLLVTRYWPRGLARGQIDLYLPDLAPSAKLLAAYRHGEIDFAGLARRYRSEMGAQKSLLRLLAWLDRDGARVTLLCTCADERHCHRRLLADLLRAQK
jgi:uncharacterized protein YeaO (DUF488 family)